MSHHRKFRLQWAGVSRLVLALLLLLGIVATAQAQEATPLPSASDSFADVDPDGLAEAQRLEGVLSDVRLEVSLDPAAATLAGEMAVTWRNPAPQALQEVWFRLFPNAAYYGEGSLTVSAVTVDGVAVTPELRMDDTSLRVPLPAPVAVGGSSEITMTFQAVVPQDSSGSYGIFTHDTRHGSWVLADWFPLLAVYDDSGWALPAVTPFGDPTYSPSAFYDVTLSTPADLQVAATGKVVAEAESGDSVTRRIVAGPARDFVIVADDDLVPRQQEVGGATVVLWTDPALDPATADFALGAAVNALTMYETRWGAYPAREIDLVQVDPDGALGIAWTGLLFLDGPALLEGYGGRDTDGLASIVAHEVSHLWWGIMIGGDSNAHGYIQEGLATVSALLYMADTYGPEVAAQELDAWIISPARRLLSAGDAIVDIPAADDQDQSLRAAALYGKGSLAFLAIRQEIGAAAFDAALRDIAQRYAWGEMTPAELRGAFERASGQDLSALWRHWFDEAAMTSEEIDALAAMFAP